MNPTAQIMTDRERRVRQRLKDDFPHYASRCLRIRTKRGAICPLNLNEAQQYIHAKLEEQRQRTGRVRALILKGRQQGSSTYVEARYFHRTTHARGVRAFILTHEDEATKNIFEMAERFYEKCPRLVRPHVGAANAKELYFDKLDSGYRVGTARTKGTGRSATLQLFHGSEVAYWSNADEHMAGVLQAVPDEAGTEIVLESTSAGAVGLFYRMCMDASRRTGEYILIFVPWFWQREYRKPVDDSFEKTSEEEGYASTHGLDDEQVNWRRHKILELGSVWAFRREYPATPDEAFATEMPGALWTRELVSKGRVDQAPPMVRIVVAVDPQSKTNKASSETGIVAAGVTANGHGYVLRDESVGAKPSIWAGRAIRLYHELGADRIVYESNQGGDMVAEVLRSVDATAPLLEVTASRSKQARAEPIAALYEQDKVHHVGQHIALEDQLCTWEPLTGQESPDRLDAMVWALTELMIGNVPIVSPSAVEGESRWGV